MQRATSVSRFAILDLAIEAVRCAARAHRQIAVTVVAQRLLDENPDCRMSLVELQDQIARFALADHVDIAFGIRPRQPSN